VKLKYYNFGANTIIVLCNQSVLSIKGFLNKVSLEKNKIANYHRNGGTQKWWVSWPSRRDKT